MTPSLEDLRSEVVAEFARFVSADPVRVGIALKRGVRLEGMEQWLLPIGELAEGYAANVSTWIGQGEDPTERARRCKLYFKKIAAQYFLMQIAALEYEARWKYRCVNDPETEDNRNFFNERAEWVALQNVRVMLRSMLSDSTLR